MLNGISLATSKAFHQFHWICHHPFVSKDGPLQRKTSAGKPRIHRQRCRVAITTHLNGFGLLIWEVVEYFELDSEPLYFHELNLKIYSSFFFLSEIFLMRFFCHKYIFDIAESDGGVTTWWSRTVRTQDHVVLVLRGEGARPSSLALSACESVGNEMISD